MGLGWREKERRLTRKKCISNAAPEIAKSQESGFGFGRIRKIECG
jgi:hypothetical protein